MLYNDSALNILSDIPENSIDMIFTDPPYNVTNLRMDKTGFDFKEYMGIFQRILKPSGWFFTFGNIEMFILLNKYWKRRFEYIWVKTNAPFAVGRMPVRKHEMLFASCQLDAKISNLYFNKYAIRTKGTPYYRKRGTKANSEFLKSRFGEKFILKASNNTGYREGTSILYYPNKQSMTKAEKTSHPTQKPLALCELICMGYCSESGTILDCFMGSGTIPLAACKTGRKYIGIEQNPEYYDIAISRFQTL